jgi:HD-GYP domain-containing protein (c-di-GMP phosphodiesterase class II)
VADVFTALTENRPYRRGVLRDGTIGILREFASNGSLDGRIVSVLIDGYEPINRDRADTQETFAAEYSRRGQDRGGGLSLLA